MTQSNPVALRQTRETILATACGGMAIALSTILSMFTIYRMPQGGTITPASMLPIIFCALAFGPLGIVSPCTCMLQFIIAPFAAHWHLFSWIIRWLSDF